jgi:AraC-like DNA-binding protein
MIARVFRPGPPLGEYVECFWHYDGFARSHRSERALPTGTVDLVFNMREDRIRSLPGAVVSGAYSEYFTIDTSLPSMTVGVHFRPGGAAPFLGVPAGELRDRHVALEDVWGAGARALRERLLEARTAEARFELLEVALLARARSRPLLMHPAVAHAIARVSADPSIARVERVREETGYGAKRFIELFRDAVGLTPKVYSRVARFGAVVERLARGERVEWADVAVAGGYYDQPHLNREFRRFAGVTPTAYRPAPGDRVFHLAVED